MPETNTMLQGKFYMGEKEFTNLMWVLIRSYRYMNKNQDPIAIVMPDVKEISGVKIEFPRRTGGKASS